MAIQCKKEGCGGLVNAGVCTVCGTACPDSSGPLEGLSSTGKRQAIMESMQEIMEGNAPSGKEDLLKAAEKFESLVPDDYASWRVQANLLLSAIKQLETRQMAPDETVSLMGVPMTEVNLRHACEKALRNCAHFAQAFEDRVALIDEANRVRQLTWF